VSRLTLRTGRRSFSLMLQFYDKALAASVLALAALASPTSADTGDPARVPACNLSDGYGTELIAFVREASACLDTPVSAAGEAMADDVHVLSNRIREKAGGNPLLRRTGLEQAARAHAMDMAARGYAAHSDETGRTHLDRLRGLDRTGIYGATGANVTVVDAEMAAVGLYNTIMSDPVNAANLGRTAFTHAGIGMAEAGGKLYVVQLFGQLDGELDAPLPLGLPAGAALDVRFADPGFSLVAWRLEDDDGLRVRRGTINRLVRTGEESGDLALVIVAERDGVIHELRGPALSADMGDAAS